MRAPLDAVAPWTPRRRVLGFVLAALVAGMATACDEHTPRDASIGATIPRVDGSATIATVDAGTSADASVPATPASESTAPMSTDDSGRPVSTVPDAGAAIDASVPATDAGGSPPIGASSDGGAPVPCAYGSGSGPIAITNLEANEAIPHALVLLRGTVAADTSTLRARVGTKESVFPVVARNYKALVVLTPGVNEVVLSTGDAQCTALLSHVPSTSSRFVRVLYVIPADGDGRFDAPSGTPNDRASAVARIRTTASLLQTFTAEAMRDQGFGRRTFRLATDADGLPRVEIFRSKLAVADARALGPSDLWFDLRDELAALPNHDTSIDLAVFATFEAAKPVYAPLRVGDVGLALVGSSSLPTWAESIDGVPAGFADVRPLEPVLVDASGGRRTYWANYASGAGDALHQLGHALGLAELPAGGVMSSDFGLLNRTFVVAEPKSATTPGYAPLTRDFETGWDRYSAVRLAFQPWLDPTDVATPAAAAPTIRRDGSDVVVESALGLRVIGYEEDSGYLVAHDEFLGTAPTVQRIPLDRLRPLSGINLTVTAMDDAGRTSALRVLLVGP